MATNYANIFRIDPSKNNQDFAGDSNTLAYFLTGRQQDNKGLPPLITGISGNQIIVKYSDDRDVSYIDVSWNISNTGTSNLPSSDISNILITGIISDGIQKKGIGQAQAIRLYDGYSNNFFNLSINDLRNKILLYIDTSNNVVIKTYGNNNYNGMTLWSVIFNIYNSFGIPLQGEKDISLNLLSNSFDNNITYDISLNSSCIIIYENTFNQNSDLTIPQSRITTNSELLDDNGINYLIDISNNNELYISTNNTDNNEGQFYLKELNFYLIDNSGNYINPYNIHFELEWYLYDISYSITEQNLFKIIYYSDMFNSSDISNIIDINVSSISNNPIKIGTFKTTGYSFFPDLNLNYYNINAVTDNSNLLIKLNTTPQILGKLNF